MMGTITPSIYQALVIAKALEFYAKTGMRINREYTPLNMYRAVYQITGKTFTRKQFLPAAQALREWMAQQ